jgi:hypothetical protein
MFVYVDSLENEPASRFRPTPWCKTSRLPTNLVAVFLFLINGNRATLSTQLMMGMEVSSAITQPKEKQRYKLKEKARQRDLKRLKAISSPGMGVKQ